MVLTWVRCFVIGQRYQETATEVVDQDNNGLEESETKAIQRFRIENTEGLFPVDSRPRGSAVEVDVKAKHQRKSSRRGGPRVS
jgi:hypothetical protein